MRHTRTIALPGGLRATVIWWEGDSREAEIHMHPDYVKLDRVRDVAYSKAHKIAPDVEKWIIVTG